MLVAQYLELYVVRFLHKFLYIYRIVAKASHRLASCGIIHLHHVLFPGDQAHTLAATAHRSLQHHGEANLLGNPHSLFGTLQRFLSARHHRHPSLYHLLTGRNLVTHLLHRLRLRTYERDALSLATAGKLGILAQETISWVNGISTMLLGCCYDMVYVEVAVAALRATYTLCFIGKQYVARCAVSGAVHSHAPYAHLVTAAHNPQGYLATIGYQNFLNHALSFLSKTTNSSAKVLKRAQTTK